MTDSERRDTGRRVDERTTELQARMELVRGYLRGRHARVEPDEGFAARVAARVRSEPVELLRWAALKLLPVSIVLVLVLAAYAFQLAPRQTPQQTVSAQSQKTDVITWLLEGRETAR